MHALSALVLLIPAALTVQDPIPRSRFLWADADGDGRMDAFVLRPDGSGHFLVGLEDGGFEDRTVTLGLGGLGELREAAWGDVQSDGRLELALVETAGRARLFVADEGGVFRDETERAGLPERGDVVAVQWLDFDRDGTADLLWHTAREELLFRGDGRGHFDAVELGLVALSPPVATPPLPDLDPDSALESTSEASDATAHVEERDPLGPGRGAADDRRQPIEGGASGPSSALGTGTAGGTSPRSAGLGTAGFDCFARIRDMATGTCIGASSVPGLGLLFPLSLELFVDAATGYVGVGTLTPGSPLHVEGAVQLGTGHTLTGTMSSILGGEGHTVDALANNSTIGGGTDNVIESSFVFFPGGLASSIVGGASNHIDSSSKSVIAGGRDNFIDGSTAVANTATISGGIGNTIDSASSATIGGGSSNHASGQGACIPGGSSNIAAGATSFAAGHAAEALHDGALVFADSDTTPFASTAPDQFLIKAAGGVGIGTNSPSGALDVAGRIQSSLELRTTNPDNPSASVSLGWLDDVARIRIGGQGVGALNGLDIQTIGNASLMRITGTGRVGIGTGSGSIDATLHVQSNSARVAKFDRFGSDGELVAWARDDVVVGNVTVTGGAVSYNAFTGSHYAWSEVEAEVGALMVLTGENRSLADERAREIVYGVEPCAVANDRACLGSYVTTTTIGEGAVASRVRLVAAVGNGDLWVVDTGVDIAPGDLLISSDVSGCAMVDDSRRFAVGHVIARAAESVDWSRIEPDAEGVRRARISALFDAFTRAFDAAAEIAALRRDLAGLHGADVGQ